MKYHIIIKEIEEYKFILNECNLNENQLLYYYAL